MAISDDFFKLLTEFVNNYKTKGAPSLWTWNKECNHEKISLHLEQLLTIIRDNIETFNDTSIIDYLNNTILQSANSNPYLLQCWIQCQQKYNLKLQAYIGIGNFKVLLPPDSKPAENIIFELEASLNKLKQSSQLAQEVNETQLKLMGERISQLEKANRELSSQNMAYKQQIKSQELFDAIHNPIKDAQKNLDSVMSLLTQLHAITEPKQIAQQQTINLLVSDQMIASKQIEPKPNDNISVSVQVQATITSASEPIPQQKNIQSAVIVPPPPKNPPPIPQSSPSFFQKKGGDMIDEIKLKLEEFKQKSKTSSQTINNGENLLLKKK